MKISKKVFVNLKHVYKKQCLFLCSILILSLGGLALFNFQIDPYFLWKTQNQYNPNELIAKKMRFAKAIKLLLNQPKVVILGSSRIYRGINTEDLPKVYNAGITSLRIKEAGAFIKHIVYWIKPNKLILGLDFFMFDANHLTQPGFDERTGSLSYILTALPASLLSWDTTKSSFEFYQQGKSTSDNGWRANGFRLSDNLTEAQNERVIDQEFRHDTYGRFQYDPKLITYLTRGIDLAKAHGIEVKLYISPLHQKLQHLLQEMNLFETFNAWKIDLYTMAKTKQVELWDFSTLNSITTSQWQPENKYYIDVSHFSPITGEYILGRLGLINSENLDPLIDFGTKIVSVD